MDNQTRHVAATEQSSAVNWRNVVTSIILTLSAGVLGLLFSVAIFLIAGTSDTPGGFPTTVTGFWAFLAFLGALLFFGSLLLVTPIAIITTMLSSNRTLKQPLMGQEDVAGKINSRATPLPVNIAEAGTAEARQARAFLGRNMQGHERRRSRGLAAYFALAFFGVFVGVFWAAILISSSPEVDSAYPVFIVFGLFFVVFAAFPFLLGGGLLRLFKEKNNDQGDYTRYLHTLPAETQQWARATISERRYTETVKFIELSAIPNPEIEKYVQQIEAFFAHGFGGGRLPKSPWAQAMWEQKGLSLMGRELVMKEIGDAIGSRFTPYLEDNAVVPVPAPTVLIDGGHSATLYQQRNEFVTEDPVYPVRIVDLIMLNQTSSKRKGYPTEYLPEMQTFTYAETWFPSDHWLHVYPSTKTRLNRWGRMGKHIDTFARQFNRIYDTQTDDEAWARLVLNPAVMKILVDLAPMRFTVDAGRIILHTHNGWLLPSKIREMADLLQEVSWSARAGEIS